MNYLGAIAAVVLTAFGVAHAEAAAADEPTTGKQKRWQVIHAAESRVGMPYVWGAAGPRRFDCSGLVQWSFRQIGIKVPRVSYDQARLGTRKALSRLRPGDLIAWPGHIAIWIGKGRIVEAPHTGADVRIRSLTPSYGFDSTARGIHLNYSRLRTA